MATQESESVVKERLAGGVFVGKMLSETVTNWIAETVFPLLSVTCHVTPVSPGGKEAGALF